MPAVVPGAASTRASGSFERTEAPVPAASPSAPGLPSGPSAAASPPAAPEAPPPAPSAPNVEAIDDGWDVAWSSASEPAPAPAAAEVPAAPPAALLDDLAATTVLPPKKSSPGLAAPPIPRVDPPGEEPAGAMLDDADRPTRVREGSEPPAALRDELARDGLTAPADEAPDAPTEQLAASQPAAPAEHGDAVEDEPTASIDTERNQAFGDTFVDEPIEGVHAAHGEAPEPAPPSLGDTVVDPPRGLLGLEDVAGLTPPPPPAADVLAELASEDYRPGDVIAGKYKLTCIIGRGGMGAVWLAHNLTLDIDVAIKLIRRDRAAPEAAARLLTEARAAARLGHASIVRVFDFGLAPAGDPYIVMEVLHGESLAAVLARKRRLSPDVAVRTLLPVISALVEAHDKGVVHRDLKPDNILLAMDERNRLVPKLVDFGIAKLIRTDVERAFTLAGEVLGSPDYMSPEQAKGEGVIGTPTDIWALSVVLYELVTGKRPFEGPNYNALIVSIITNEPIPMHERGVDDPALWAVIQRGLAKDIGERWPSMSELGRALALWAVERGLVEDVAGTAIAAHWLVAPKRALSVYPPSSTAESHARHHPKPAAGAAPGAASLRPAVETMVRPPFQADRTPWVLGVMLAIGGVLAALLTWSALSSGVAETAPASPNALASSATPPAAGTEAATAATAPPASPSASTAASPSASASASATPKTPLRPRGKPAAPPVPKGISF